MTTLVLLIHHQQEYLIIYVIYLCVIVYYITNIIINIICVKDASKQAAGPGANSNLKVSVDRSRKSKHLQCTPRPLAQVLCHLLRQSSLGESPTKGAMGDSSGSETPLKLKTLGLILTSGQFVFVPEVEGKCVGRFWDGGIWAEGC